MIGWIIGGVLYLLVGAFLHGIVLGPGGHFADLVLWALLWPIAIVSVLGQILHKRRNAT